MAEKLQTLAQRKAKLQQELARITGQESAERRKADTRRKILIGGLVLEAAAKDERTAAWLEQLVRAVKRPQDAKAFEGWKVPRPAKAVTNGN